MQSLRNLVASNTMVIWKSCMCNKMCQTQILFTYLQVFFQNWHIEKRKNSGFPTMRSRWTQGSVVPKAVFFGLQGQDSCGQDSRGQNGEFFGWNIGTLSLEYVGIQWDLMAHIELQRYKQLQDNLFFCYAFQVPRCHSR